MLILRTYFEVGTGLQLFQYALFFLNRIMKRLFDFIVTIIGLTLLSPALLFLYLLIRRRMGTSVLFRQQRPGLNARPFYMYKFRTMTNACDENGCLLPDEDRLTSLGRFLRATSLDELPELFNVLKGDMSLVGPRPLLMQYLDRYTPEQARRHEVRSGVTGWAQINGRNAITWEEKFKLDVWYVDHHTFGLDIKILLTTLVKVFNREGINAAGEATMGKFKGSLNG